VSVYTNELGLTEYVEQGKEFAEEVSVGPEVVVLEVRVQVVQEQLLFGPFFGLGDDAQVKVHLECPNLAGLPVRGVSFLWQC